MSLVGNLEDLSLGDIMQIISLSQKSGVLALDGDEGSGRIVFRLGLVQAACVKGRPDDLRELLVGAGQVEAARFDEWAAHARELGQPVEEMIVQEGGLSSEQIDGLLRESVEASVLEMFSWLSGDFSFDVRSKLESDDPGLLLSSGINAQYLAMEGMRIRDEQSRDESPVQAGSDCTASPLDSHPTVEPFFGDEPLETEAFLSDEESEVVAYEVDDELSATDVLVATVVTREDEGAGQASARDVATPTPPNTATRMTPVVLIDPDVSVLESVKATIQDYFSRVHVFQQADQGLARIRQYLIRGELPVVLISTEIRIDPLSGIHGLSDFVDRLKTQAAKLVVIGLHEDVEGRQFTIPTAFDGVLVRPGRQLHEQSETIKAETALELTSALHQILADRNASDPAPTARSQATKQASVRDLRDATGKLQQASSRGEVLPVVLDFASELFARVAILIVREEQVFAIAGRGIEALEVDPLDTAPPVSLQALDRGWIRQALQSGEPFQAPPTTPADRELLARLGGAEPTTAYIGPIESGGSTIALLYCDQASNGEEMPDTSGLEVVLHHAGMALDRAALERALWEADAEQS
jgi:hypothetical protein